MTGSRRNERSVNRAGENPASLNHRVEVEAGRLLGDINASYGATVEEQRIWEAKVAEFAKRLNK